MLFIGTALCVATGAAAGPLQEAAPDEIGLSAQRLERLSQTMQRYVDQGELAGMVVMIARKGKLVYQKAFGMQDKTKKVPMAADSIFRIYSMTKPVVTVAAMILIEDGRLSLDQPIAKYLPEFKDMKVGVESYDGATGAQAFYTVPAKRQITVQDLMRHTSGFTYGNNPKTQVQSSTRRPDCSRRSGLWTASARNSPSSHFSTNPAPSGNTVTRATCSAAWSRPLPARHSTGFSPSASSNP